MLSFNKNAKLPSEKEHKGLKNVKNGKTDSRIGSLLGEVSQTEALHILDDLSRPPPPVLESGSCGKIDITDIQKSLQNLYDYNVILRDKLTATQSILHALRQKSHLHLWKLVTELVVMLRTFIILWMCFEDIQISQAIGDVLYVKLLTYPINSIVHMMLILVPVSYCMGKDEINAASITMESRVVHNLSLW